jgi:branched-chain amino acid aminotransferase
MFGTSVGLGVRPSKDALIVVYCSPVGPYFKSGIKPIRVAADRSQDRSAQHGTGDVKVGGNYASSLLCGEMAHKNGFANVLFLDSVERRFIEECGAANFFAIKDGQYITPKSPSILPSITNKSLRQIAQDLGLEVVERPIDIEELSTFEECGACGTAAVISPIGFVHDMQTGKDYQFDMENVGEWSMKLYNTLRDIQYGRCEDKHGWNLVVEVEE